MKVASLVSAVLTVVVNAVIDRKRSTVVNFSVVFVVDAIANVVRTVTVNATVLEIALANMLLSA